MLPDSHGNDKVSGRSAATFPSTEVVLLRTPPCH